MAVGATADSPPAGPRRAPPQSDDHAAVGATADSPPAGPPAVEATAEQLAAVSYNRDGLVPAVVQDAETGRVLMMAWMNAEALSLTLDEGRTVFWSRSRQEIWRKGDTSGAVQRVREAHYDCDGDTLLFVVDQEGEGACHTGAFSCFFRSFGEPPAAADGGPA